MSTMTADAVVIGGGHHGLVAAAVLADAGLGRVRPGVHRRGRRGDPVRRAVPRLHRRPVQCLLPVVGRLPGAARAGARAPRPALDARAERARASTPPGRRPGRRAAPRPGGTRPPAWPRTTPGTGTRGCGCASSGTGSASRSCARMFSASRRCGVRCSCCAGPAPRTPCGWPGSCCCRPGGWARSCSRPRRPGCCWPATRCTPTHHRTRRAAASSAGCWPCSASSYGFPVPVGGSGRAGRGAGSAGRPRPARRSSPGSTWRASRSGAAGRAACTPQPG